jgi:hypothetical protein
MWKPKVRAGDYMINGVFRRLGQGHADPTDTRLT